MHPGGMVGKLQMERGDRDAVGSTFEALLEAPHVAAPTRAACQVNLAMLPLFQGDAPECSRHLALVDADAMDAELSCCVERVHAALEVRNDRLPQAIEHARAAVRFARDSGLEEQRFFATWVLAWNLLIADQLEETEAELDRLDGMTLPPSPIAGALRDLLRASHHMSRAAEADDVAAFTAALEAMGALRPAFAENNNHPVVSMIDSMFADLMADDAPSLDGQLRDAWTRLRDVLRGELLLGFAH